MYYSEDIVEDVRVKNDIIDVLSGYIKLQKKGSSHFGLCPFHNEKSPSFSVSQEKQMYYCFGCGAGGNVFTFIMEYENYSFVEALKMLAQRVSVTLPETQYTEEAKKKASVKSILLEVNKQAATYFYAQLKKEQGGLAYAYLKGRGLDDQVVTGFGLGYANKYSDDLYKFLKAKGYSDEMMVKAGLVSVNERQGVYDKFWNRVMFPILDVNNRVIGFGGRVMGDGVPKYLNSPETMIFDKSRNLYGLNKARTSRKPYLIVCEGYMDVIAMYQAGFNNVVASLGTALTAGHAVLMKRYVKEVYLAYDSDEAGIKAMLRAMPILREAGLSVKVIRMQPYKDPDEFISNQGVSAFEERIAAAQNGFMFGIEMLEREYDMHSPEGKTAFFNEVARRLIDFEEEIERNNYIEAVEKVYRVGFDNLRKLVSKVAISSGLAKPAKQPRRLAKHEKTDGNLIAQKAMLTWLSESTSLFEQIRRYIGPEDFTVPLYRKVADILYEQYGSGQVNQGKIINYFTDEEEHREVASLFHTKIHQLTTKGEQEKAIKDTIIQVKENSINTKEKLLKPTDMEGLQKSMGERKELQDWKDLHNLHISID